jgi:hypothetical protein
MKKVYTPSDKEILLSLHDLKVDFFQLEDHKLLFHFKNIDHYDSMKYQNIDNRMLELEILIADFDFCNVTVRNYKNRIFNKIKEYDLKEFFHRFSNDQISLYVLDFLRSYNGLIMIFDGKYGIYEMQIMFQQITYKFY